MTRPIPAFGRLYPDIVRAGSFGALVDQMFWTLGSELRSEPNASWHRVDVVADARVGSLETGTDSRSFHVRIRQHDAKRVLLAGGRTDRLWQAVSAIRSILEQQDRAVSELTGPYRFLDLERTQVSVRAGATEGRGSPGPTAAAGGRRAAPPRLDLVREPPPEPPGDAELTPEERRLLGWLADDRDTSEMARSLGVSVSTVREHLRRLLAKLGATGRGPWPPPPSRA